MAKPSETSRDWRDWLGIALGLAIILAPWIVNEHSNRQAVINATISGAAILLLAEFDLVRQRGWAEAGQIAIGLWVAISPWVYGYAEGGKLQALHVAAGLLTAGLGALELRHLRTPGA